MGQIFALRYLMDICTAQKCSVMSCLMQKTVHAEKLNTVNIAKLWIWILIWCFLGKYFSAEYFSANISWQKMAEYFTAAFFNGTSTYLYPHPCLSPPKPHNFFSKPCVFKCLLQTVFCPPVGRANTTSNCDIQNCFCHYRQQKYKSQYTQAK